ncbi:DUF732 domain-containing protein [Mycolicibacterium pulveris]|uniref:DUF732 domain-containing protein n=1 Tax=Mycolicibacterium pulveris TaxID=36813 RepID=UPI003CF04248
MEFTAFRRGATAVFAAFLVTAGAVLSVPPAHAGEVDDQFLELLDLERVPYANQTEVIRAGKEYCLARTRPNAQMGPVNNELMDKMGWAGSELSDFARAALRAYC